MIPTSVQIFSEDSPSKMRDLILDRKVILKAQLIMLMTFLPSFPYLFYSVYIFLIAFYDVPFLHEASEKFLKQYRKKIVMI